MIRAVRWLPLVSAVLVFACGESRNSKGKPDLEGTQAGLCVRDEAKMAERRQCQRDDTCPCGTHCELGVCEASCVEAADCGQGEYCDDFGRCRNQEDTQRLPSFSAPSAPDLRLQPHRVELDTEKQARPFWISLAAEGQAEARIQASEGLEVRCAEDGPFAQECRRTLTQEASPTWVRATSPIDDKEVRTVRVVAGGRVRYVLVSNSRAKKDLTEGKKPVRGIYAGSARLLRAGLAGAAAHDLDDRLEVPLRVSLFGDAKSGTLVLHDRFRALSHEAEWAGTVAGGKITLPLRAAVDVATYPGLDVQLLVSGKGTLRTDPDGGVIALELTLTSSGFGPDGEELEQHFGAILTREGDLPEGAAAPLVQADATPRLFASRGLTPSTWETRLWNALDRPLLGPASAEYQKAAKSALGGTGVPAFCPDPEQSEPGLIGWVARSLEAALEAHPSDSGVGLSWSRTHDDGSTFFQHFARPFVSSISGSVTVSGVASQASFDDVRVPVPPLRGYLDGAVPCALELQATQVPAKASHYLTADSDGYCRNLAGFDPDQTQKTVNLPGVTIDRCAELETLYGCRTEDLDEPYDLAATFSATAYYQSGQCQFHTLEGASSSARVSKVCRLPDPTAGCAVAALCANPAANAYQEVSLGGDLEYRGGDPYCAGTQRVAGLGFWAESELANARDLMEQCVADLATLKTDLDKISSVEAITDKSCVTSGRLLAALGAGLSQLSLPQDLSGDPLRAPQLALSHRLAQVWLELHTFLARESREGERLAEVVRRLEQDRSLGPPSPAELTPMFVASWNLFLHPRFGAALAKLPASTLREPDPRPLYGIVNGLQNHHDHPVGLPALMAEALESQLGLMIYRLERAGEGRDATAKADFGDLLRSGLWVRALAAHLAGKVASDATHPGWWNRYLSAARAAQLQLAQALAVARAGERPNHALGIDDNDLPLYFLGDEASVASRFSAISDFLLGAGPSSSTRWASAAVKQAEDALAQARAAWTAFQARRVLRQQDQSQLEAQLDAIRFEFGDRVAQYCSAPGTLATADILEHWADAHGRPFSAEECYRAYDRPGCEVDHPVYTGLKAEDYGYHLCMARATEQFSGQPYRGRASVMRLVRESEACAAPSLVSCAGEPEGCLRCADFEVPVREVQAELPRLVAFAIDADRASDREACGKAFPNASTRLPGAQSPGALDPRCYRGALGEQALTIEAAARDIEVAQAEIDELSEAYDIAMQSCAKLEETTQAVQDARKAHQETMQLLRGFRAALEVTAHIAGAVKDCATAAKDDLTFGVAGGTACGAATVQAAANAGIAGINAEMENVEAAHEAAIAKLQEDAAIEICKNDASMHLVGMKSASLRLLRAFDDLMIAQYQFEEMKISADTYYADGLLALERARERFVTSPAHDFWLDEAVSRFERRMRFAKRLLYLGVRAVEWEFQESLLARAAVLDAELPSELEDVLEELWSLAGTRSINGRRPSELRLVVSLRDELLRIADRSEVPAGEQALSPTERFRMLLKDPQFAVFDADGNYRGQRISFSLAPAGTFASSDLASIGVLSSRDCAERVWSVNAAIQGSDEAIVGGSSFVRVELEKNNTFYSQWCRDNPDREFQVASVRPSKNLFRGGSDEVSSVLGLSRAPDEVSAARLQAALNVSRAELESDTYTERASGELAARGLYGDYALFIPASSISVSSRGERPSDGLNLDEVEDVLVRFDYVSVARN